MPRNKANISPAKLGLTYLLTNLTVKDFQGGVGGWWVGGGWVGGEMLGIRLISAQLSWD